jgi:hypothetical protein
VKQLLSDDLFLPVEADAGRREGGTVVHQELPARPDLDHYRKDAKAFVRAFRDSESRAVRRAEAVLGRRAHARFALSDAQYVIAVEHGYASWAELKRACERSGLDGLQGVERGEVVLGYDLRYTEGEPVEVYVKKRLHAFDITDRGNAVRLAGKPPGWLEAATSAVDEYSLNVSRRGVVFVGTVYPRMLEWLCSRTAEASLAVYAAVRDLDEN